MNDTEADTRWYCTDGRIIVLYGSLPMMLTVPFNVGRERERLANLLTNGHSARPVSTAYDIYGKPL